MAEQVFLVRRGDLFPGRLPRGFEPGNGLEYLERAARHGEFAWREPAERDPERKQIIPYGVVSVAGDDPRVLLLQRTRKGGESRLHGLFSLGVGGHINPLDGSPSGGSPLGDGARALIHTAFLRELNEELEIDAPYRWRIVGVVNDETTAVGQVHFGIVYRVWFEAPRVRVREVEELRGTFVRPAELLRYRDRMESWSSLLVDRLEWWEGPF